jgi:hypothetical protein
VTAFAALDILGKQTFSFFNADSDTSTLLPARCSLGRVSLSGRVLSNAIVATGIAVPIIMHDYITAGF